MKRLVFDEDVVTATDSAGVLVCYQKGDKNEAHEKSKEISQALQAHLVGDVLENLKPDASISNETMAHALTISEAHFESQVSREDLDDPARFEKAVRRAIETTQTDESAPGLLISSIKEDHGRLRPLDLVASYGTNIPIRFFNFDPHSREKMRSSFALYREENREKAEYLIDVLFLDFIAQEMRLLPINDIIVVDVHFGTLNSANYFSLYVKKISRFCREYRSPFHGQYPSNSSGHYSKTNQEERSAIGGMRQASVCADRIFIDRSTCELQAAGNVHRSVIQPIDPIRGGLGVALPIQVQFGEDANLTGS